MAESIEHYARSVERILKEQRVLNHLRRELRKPVPIVRKAIKVWSLAILPKAGGLNAWAAAIKIKFTQQVAGKTIRIHLKGGRNSQGGQSDVKALDRGRVRHPSWGRRFKGQWHSQAVSPGFFTTPATDPAPWVEAADRALDTSLEEIR